MNGIVFGDLEPKPQYYEVKKVYQNMAVKAIDIEKGQFGIFNKYYFKDLSDYDVKWSLYENGKEIQSGPVTTGIVPARHTVQVVIPYQYNNLKKDSEYFVKVQFLLKNDMPWHMMKL